MVKSFRSRFHDELEKCGFVRSSNGVVIASDDVSCIVQAGVSMRLPQVTFGLWFFKLGGAPAPERYEHCHIYGGAETICQLQTRIRRESYRKTDEELNLQTEHILGMVVAFAGCLKAFLEMQAVTEKYAQGLFGQSFIRADARTYLERLMREPSC